MTRVAVIQMVSSDQLDDNLQRAEVLVRKAAGAGAKLVALPENFALMGRRQSDVLSIAEAEGEGPIQQRLAVLARSAGIWLLAGTMPMQTTQPDRVHSASLLFDDQGHQVARYNKIHLYDVDLPGRDESYRESNTFQAGDALQVVETPVGRLGLSVCYDLRFPELYRALQSQGADLFAIPSAFTATTGAAHWHTLIKARAIENLCTVLAPNQGGRHVNGRETYGHSLIVDPWGVTLAEAGTGEAVLLADLDQEAQRRMRQDFPVLQHHRLNIKQGKTKDE